MKRFLPFIAFACLTGFIATSGLPVMAGSCSNHINKKAEIKCSKDDTECQTKQVEAIELNNTVRS